MAANQLTFKQCQTLLLKHSKESTDQLIQSLKNRDLYHLVDDQGTTLLHLGAHYNHLEFCRFLLENELIHVNLTDHQDQTALYYAIATQSYDVVNLLLEFNANPEIGRPIKASDSAINNRLIEIVKTTVPIIQSQLQPIFTLYAGYRYRLYLQWLNGLNHYFRSNQPYNTLYPEINTIYQQFGLVGLGEQCQIRLREFQTVIKPTITDLGCLDCGRKAKDGLKICGKCMKVRFCNRLCQEHAHPLHKLDCHLDLRIPSPW